MEIDWVQKAKILFAAEKPEHFTNFNHCAECFEHNETLRNSDFDQIGLAELGNPGWDPMCFISIEGKKYYMPALVRLSIETIKIDAYFDQFLSHIYWNMPDNDLVISCSAQQQEFIAQFLEYMISTYPGEIESLLMSDDALGAYEYWASGGNSAPNDISS